jgi:hypothetical protein
VVVKEDEVLARQTEDTVWGVVNEQTNFPLINPLKSAILNINMPKWLPDAAAH